MNILMIGHFVPYPPHGGSLQRSFNILREISKNHKIHLLALNQKAILPDEKRLNESIQALKNYCETIGVFKIPTDYSRFRWYLLLFLNLFSLTPFTVWWFRSKELAAEINRQVKNKPFNLIHFDTIDLYQYAGFAPAIPKILNHHNVESMLLFRRSAKEKNPLIKLFLYLQGWKLRRYEKKVIGKVDVNIAVSAGDKENLQQLEHRARIEVVPNGTDIDYFGVTEQNRSTELIFVGGMNWYPNRDAMLYFCDKIFPLIKKEIPDTTMNIIGQEPPHEIERLSEQDSSIKVHGFVKDIREYISRSAVYVVPIRVGGGTRLKILDAFACGKALVSTSVGCEGIEVTPGENILIGDTPEDFAAQVVRIIRDEALKKKLEIKARQLVEQKYSWSIIGKLMNEIIGSLSK
jgi:sugar transferase (PEP-CTERM/EpsH1 system associated)